MSNHLYIEDGRLRRTWQEPPDRAAALEAAIRVFLPAADRLERERFLQALQAQGVNRKEFENDGR